MLKENVGIWEFQQEGQVFVRGEYCYGKPNGWFPVYDQSGTLRMAGFAYAQRTWRREWDNGLTGRMMVHVMRMAPGHWGRPLVRGHFT